MKTKLLDRATTPRAVVVARSIAALVLYLVHLASGFAPSFTAPLVCTGIATLLLCELGALFGDALRERVQP